MIEFGVLGPLRVCRDGSAVPGLNALLVRRLLAALLSRVGTSMLVDELTQAIWGHHPPPTSRKTLQVYVRRLRAILGDDQIAHEADGYRIEISDHQLDAAAFAHLVNAARHDERKDHAAELLEQALGLWRGSAFEDVREHSPLAEEARRLDEEKLLAETRLTELQIELGRHHDAIPHLVKLIEEHPFREELREHLMLALYRSGRQTEALEIYAGTRKLLAEELGVEPGPSLQRLHEAILRAAPELDLPAKQTPRQLPIDVGGFVGRAEQLNALDEMALGNAPILIAGTAGVGKTALAVRWAHQVASRFPDGQLYLNLNGFTTSAPMQPIEALAMMLRSIGVSAEKVPVEPFEAAALLRTEMADRSMLMLLDNTRSADQVRPLLPGGSGNLVLITSRNKLGGLIAQEGARRLDLNVLLPEEARELLAHAVGTARAAAHEPATAQLARVCAYLPLALRVAAANLADSPDRTVGSLVAALESGNRLTSLVVDADDDQAAVRAAFDSSYLDASPVARQTFRLLGLVPGTSFTPHAVAALADTDLADADAQLWRLSNAHLIERIAPDRFTFHDLLRLYARERAIGELGDRERTAAITRLYDWYVASVDAAANVVYPSLLRLPIPSAVQMTGVIFDKAEHGVEWLDAERANLIAAIQSAADNERPEASWLLSSGLRGYFTRRIHLSDLHLAVRTALDIAVSTADMRAQASMHLTIAHVSQARSEFDLAFSHLRRGAELGRAAKWHELEAMCLGNMAGISLETGTLEEARRWIERSVALCRKAGYRKGEAISLSNLGVVANKAGRFGEAVQLLQQACRVAKTMGLAQLESAALDDLGEVQFHLGRLDEAISTLDLALQQKAAIGDWLGEALVTAKLARIQLARGQSDEALRLAESAAHRAEAVGNRPARAIALTVLGSVRASTGHLRGALVDLESAAEITNGLVGAQEAKILAGLGLADVRRRLGDGSQAADQAYVALESARRAGFRVLEGRALTILAQVEADRGRHLEAASHAKAALENQREIGHRLWDEQTTDRLVALSSGQRV